MAARTALWSMAMPKERTFALSFRMCIPYAGRLPVLPQMPAAPLQAGHPYEVVIDVKTPQQAGAPHSYRARFCLDTHSGGALQVRTLGPQVRPSCTH
jgi:hypothetical protein